MDDKRFWDILTVACSSETVPEDWDEGLTAELRKLSPAEIVAFDCLFDDKTDKAYTYDLWGAAYLINGGASDDGFYYFRCWLVAMGKVVYDAALFNPDNLAEVVLPDEVYEAEIYGAARAACRARGISDEAYDDLQAQARGDRVRSNIPTGQRWNFDKDAEVRRRFPLLAAKYLEVEAGDPEWLEDSQDLAEDQRREDNE